MKKILCLIIAMAMLLSLAACGAKAPEAPQPPVEETASPAPETTPDESPDEDNNASGETLGQTLLQDFTTMVNENPELGAAEIADKLMQNPAIEFVGATAPVEPGLLTGFSGAEINGFEEGAMFAPGISTIPFVGYIFVLSADADAEAFVKTLTDNADPRWNICTEAEETIAEHIGNVVFFVMCPTGF